MTDEEKKRGKLNQKEKRKPVEKTTKKFISPDCIPH